MVGFIGNKLFSLRTIGLLVTIRTGDQQITRVIDLLVVDCPSAYNVILRRPTLNRMRAVTLTYHLLMHFLIEGEVGEVRGDQVAAQECYMASLKGESAQRRPCQSIV